MNNQRRKEIAEVMTDLDNLGATKNALIERLEAIRDAEDEALENLPESLQESERADVMREAVAALDSAISELEGFDLEDITAHLEEAGQ